MSYVLADTEYRSKKHLTDHCREIIAATSDGADVAQEHLPFLFELFQHHEEWLEKSFGGVLRVTTQTTDHGTRCFVLVRTDSTAIDISFAHSIKCVPSKQPRDMLPQRLLDYRNAARTAISDQVRDFRDRHIPIGQTCPITGEMLTRLNAVVDHVAPLTFDRLLFDFTSDGGIDPIATAVVSRNGTVALFENDSLTRDWAEYHRNRSNLRLMSRSGHAQLRKDRIDWSALLRQ